MRMYIFDLICVAVIVGCAVYYVVRGRGGANTATGCECSGCCTQSGCPCAGNSALCHNIETKGEAGL